MSPYYFDLYCLYIIYHIYLYSTLPYKLNIIQTKLKQYNKAMGTTKKLSARDPATALLKIIWAQRLDTYIHTHMYGMCRESIDMSGIYKWVVIIIAIFNFLSVQCELHFEIKTIQVSFSVIFYGNQMQIQ